MGRLFTIIDLALSRGPSQGSVLLIQGLLRLLDSSTQNSGLACSAPVYWRVEGSLLDLTTVQPVAFFTWNAQTFAARMARRGLVFLMAALRPFLYAAHRVFATRVVHAVLRGVSRDRLDLLGDEYFQYKLKPHLKPDGLASLKRLQAQGADIVLVSQGLDHVMRPLAEFLGVKWLVANRLDFRDRVATGRLLSPVDSSPRSICSHHRGGARRPTRTGSPRAGVEPARRQRASYGHCSFGTIDSRRRASGRLLRQSQACSALFRPAVQWLGNM